MGELLAQSRGKFPAELKGQLVPGSPAPQRVLQDQPPMPGSVQEPLTFTSMTPGHHPLSLPSAQADLSEYYSGFMGAGGIGSRDQSCPPRNFQYLIRMTGPHLTALLDISRGFQELRTSSMPLPTLPSSLGPHISLSSGSEVQART